MPASSRLLIESKSMTVKEIYDQIDSFDDDKRKTFLGGLCKKLSSLSMQTLRNFENTWDGSGGFEEFCKLQAKKFKVCIEFEIGSVGHAVRMSQGLEPLTWETEIVA